MTRLALTLTITAALIACSGSDDRSALGGATPSRGGETNETNATDPATGGGGGGSNDTTDAGATTDSGIHPGDAGTDAQTIDPNPFAGAPAYVAKLGSSARKTAHPFTNDNPAGHDCFQCHGDLGNATPMAFGGTVYASAGSTTPAAKVEIRVKDKDGKAISAWSDADGNFYFFVNPNGDLNLPGHAGVRDAKGSKTMTDPLLKGNCNGCHNPNNAGRLVAP